MADRQKTRKQRLIKSGLVLVAAFLIGLTVSALAGVVMSGIAFWMLSRRVGIPVMTYHSVSADADWLPWARNISVRPEVFTRHMDVLKSGKWTVIPDRVLFDVMAGKAEVPARSVVLHFDDAYADVFANAVPVLKRHNFPACVFASSDFIDQSADIRADLGTAPKGYMNAAELVSLDTDPNFEISSHGKDHSRIAIAGATVPRPEPKVWGPETAYLWSMFDGDKSRWFETAPPHDTEIPANDSALTARQEGESEIDQLSRITASLKAARGNLSNLLGRDVTYLCWPFDRVNDVALKAATQAGFTHVTGGRDDNRAGSGATMVSRTHVNDFAAGPAPLWVEALVFHAKLEVASGNLLWMPITTLAKLRRKRTITFLHSHLA